LKKKEAKKLLLLVPLARLLPQPAVNRSFLLLFFKKKRFVTSKQIKKPLK
jgi:hypothetical protein